MSGHPSPTGGLLLALYTHCMVPEASRSDSWQKSMDAMCYKLGRLAEQQGVESVEGIISTVKQWAYDMSGMPRMPQDERKSIESDIGKIAGLEKKNWDKAASEVDGRIAQRVGTVSYSYTGRVAAARSGASNVTTIGRP